MRIPLFPLNTVLFPEGTLSLRVFEPRYLQMVGDCLRQDSPFGVCLIHEGSEVGAAATPVRVGTLGYIADWEQRPEGLLGITVRGGQRFVIEEQVIGPQQLLTASIRLLDEPPSSGIAAEFEPLCVLLRRILEQLGGPYRGIEPRYDDARWVGCRLAEILPLPLRLKQRLLELDDPYERLRCLHQGVQRPPGNE